MCSAMIQHQLEHYGFTRELRTYLKGYISTPPMKWIQPTLETFGFSTPRGRHIQCVRGCLRSNMVQQQIKFPILRRCATDPSSAPVEGAPEDYIGHVAKNWTSPELATGRDEQSMACSSKARQLSAHQKWSSLQTTLAAASLAQLATVTAVRETGQRKQSHVALSAAASSSGRSTEGGDCAGNNTLQAGSYQEEMGEKNAPGPGREPSFRSPRACDRGTESSPGTTGATACILRAATKEAVSMSETPSFDDEFQVPASTSTRSARSKSFGYVPRRAGPGPEKSSKAPDIEPRTRRRASLVDVYYAPYWWLDGYKHPHQRQWHTWPVTPEDYEVPWYLEAEIRAANLKMRTHIEHGTSSAPGSPRTYSSSHRHIAENLELTASKAVPVCRPRARSLSFGWKVSQTWGPDYSLSTACMLAASHQDTFVGDTMMQDYFLQEDFWSEQVPDCFGKLKSMDNITDGKDIAVERKPFERRLQLGVTSATKKRIGVAAAEKCTAATETRAAADLAPNATQRPSKRPVVRQRPALVPAVNTEKAPGKPHVPGRQHAPQVALERSTMALDKPTPAALGSPGQIPANVTIQEKTPFVLAITPNVPKPWFPTHNQSRAPSSDGVGTKPGLTKKSKKQRQHERNARRQGQALENRRRQEGAKKARDLERQKLHEESETGEIPTGDTVLTSASNAIESTSTPQVLNTHKPSPLSDPGDLEWPKPEGDSPVRAPPEINATPHDIPQSFPVIQPSESHDWQQVAQAGNPPPVSPPPSYTSNPVPRGISGPQPSRRILPARAPSRRPPRVLTDLVPNDPPNNDDTNANGRTLLSKIHAMAGSTDEQTGNVKDLVAQEVEIMREMEAKQRVIELNNRSIETNKATISDLTADQAADEPSSVVVVSREIDGDNTQRPPVQVKAKDTITDRQAEIERNLAALRRQIAAKQEAVEVKKQAKGAPEPAPTPQSTVWKPHAGPKDPRTFQPPSDIKLEMHTHETELENWIIQYDGVKRLGDDYDNWSPADLRFSCAVLEEACTGITIIYKKMERLLLKAKNRELGWNDDVVVPDSFMEQFADVADRNLGRIVDLEKELGVAKISFEKFK